MKRFGEKEALESIKNCCYIQVSTMPYGIIKPEIGLYGFDENANEILLGSISVTTFYNMVRKGRIRKQKSYYSYDLYW